MKYVKFICDTPYCGTETEEYLSFDDDITEEELNDILNDIIHDNAESFEYCATGWGEDFESEEDREAYYEDCTGSWAFVTKEEYEENISE